MMLVANTPKKSHSVHVVDLGLKEYRAVYELQRKLVNKKKSGEDGADYLLMVEHPPVYTLGRKFSPQIAHSLPTPHVYIERGGEATYHNPGQLIVYPILKLDEGERDIHEYLRRLEETFILTMSKLGVLATRKPTATGVWVNQASRKIVSIGIAVSSWITYHGCALNVSNDLSGFHLISPCGFSAEIMTSLRELLENRQPTMGLVKTLVANSFSKVFDRELTVA